MTTGATPDHLRRPGSPLASMTRAQFDSMKERPRKSPALSRDTLAEKGLELYDITNLSLATTTARLS